jgi:hypothetical protein
MIIEISRGMYLLGRESRCCFIAVFCVFCVLPILGSKRERRLIVLFEVLVSMAGNERQQIRILFEQRHTHFLVSRAQNSWVIKHIKEARGIFFVLSELQGHSSHCYLLPLNPYSLSSIPTPEFPFKMCLKTKYSSYSCNHVTLIADPCKDSSCTFPSRVSGEGFISEPQPCDECRSTRSQSVPTILEPASIKGRVAHSALLKSVGSVSTGGKPMFPHQGKE